MFSHHKLKVYDKAVSFAAAVATLSADWPKVHAVVEQLQRASESVMVNIVEAARLHSVPAKQRTLDYAIGSALECAAGLDIARIKGLVPADECRREKHRLCEATRMLIGLRKSWAGAELHEEAVAYAGDHPETDGEKLFHHEGLDVYRAALDVVRWLHSLPGGRELNSRLHREIDKNSTSMVLNIAEGNGRYFESDQRKFLEIAHRSTVKTATYVDLCERREELGEMEARPGRELLGRISAMLDRMAGY